MAKAHFITPLVPEKAASTVRLGTAGVGNGFTTADEGKLVKLTAESRYELCVAGDAIEGVVLAVETGTSGGYTVGSLVSQAPTRLFATADGLQGTPGTGAIAVGDYVVAGSITARNTALAAFPKVCKATSQAVAPFMWRVMSLGTVGTGAVGTQIVIERI